MEWTALGDALYKYILAPVLIFGWWLFRKYDKRLDEVEQRLHKIETDTAILETKLDSLKEGIDDIKAQLQRLFDILQRH